MTYPPPSGQYPQRAQYPAPQAAYAPPRAPVSESAMFGITFVAVLLALLVWAIVSPLVNGILEAAAPGIYCRTWECVVTHQD